MIDPETHYSLVQGVYESVTTSLTENGYTWKNVPLSWDIRRVLVYSGRFKAGLSFELKESGCIVFSVDKIETEPGQPMLDLIKLRIEQSKAELQ
jgi:hypothetical protein